MRPYSSKKRLNPEFFTSIGLAMAKVSMGFSRLFGKHFRFTEPLNTRPISVAGLTFGCGFKFTPVLYRQCQVRRGTKRLVL